MNIIYYYDATPTNQANFSHCSSDAQKWINTLEQHKNEMAKLTGEVILTYLSKEQRVHVYSFSDDGIMEKLYATIERMN